MWDSVSDRLLECLTKNHHAVRSKMEILVDGQVELTIRGKTVVDQTIGKVTSLIGGGVTVQRAEIRRSADATCLDLSQVAGDLTPTEADDLFAPSRTEFRLWRGYEYHDATPYERMTGTGIEYWPIGTFIIRRAKMVWPQIQLSGYDRLWNLRGGFQQPYSIANDTPKMVALDALLRKIMPTATADIQLPTSNGNTPRVTWDQQDRQLTRAHDLAISDGRALYADPMGTIRAVDEPEADSDLVEWIIAPGRANIAGRPEREIDATDAENVVIATGESDGTRPPVSGRAADTNPASFTYIGKTPQVTRFYSSPLLTTVGECNLAARTILLRELGVADQIVVPMIPHPGLESGDVIQVTDPKTKLDTLVLADAFNVPLAYDGVMSIECRTQVLP